MKTRMLLVIDDDRDTSESIRLLMESEQWQVVSVLNGNEGIETAKRLHPDLIVLDILMPVKDGLSTFEELKRDPSLRAIPVVMLTSVSERLGFNYDGDDMASSIGNRPEAFLRKPFDPDHFISTLRRLTE